MTDTLARTATGLLLSDTRLVFPRWIRGVGDALDRFFGMAGSLGPLGVSRHTASVLASVPWVAQWKFNGNGNDSIGANHLTGAPVGNEPTFTAGILGGATGATQLDAAQSQYWSVNDNPTISMGAGRYMTVCAWVNLTAKGAQRNIVQQWQNSNASWLLAYNNASNRFSTLASTTGSHLSYVAINANALGGPNLGQWYCLIARYDGAKVYISGNAGTENSVDLATGIFNSSAALWIGSSWTGLIDNVCLAVSSDSSAAMNAEQRTAFYNAGVGTEAITQAIAYRKQMQTIWRNIGKLWERSKRARWTNGYGAHTFAFR